MSWLDSAGWFFGFGLGSSATEGAINAVSNRYRAKDFDPVVRQDLLDIMTKGRLANIAYPFPKDFKKPKKPLFIFRHKIFSISFLLFCLITLINPNFLFEYEALGFCFIFFWIGCVFVMFVKKVLRGGKKASDILFQTEFINQGKKYWQIREYVRQALETGELNAQGAYNRIRNTELGRQLPDSDTELEAKAFNMRNKS